MSAPHWTDEAIYAWLAGTLPEAEAAELQRSMADDEALATRVAEATVRHRERMDLQERLEGMRAELEAGEAAPGQETPVRKLRWWPMAAAAAVVLAMVLFAWPQGGSHHDLFEEHFEVYSALSVPRDAANAEQATMADAMDHYRDGRYHEARTVLKPLAEQDYLPAFYAGVAVLALDTPAYAEAVGHFNTVLSSTNTYREQARWYLALAHTGAGSLTEAQLHLDTILMDAYSYNRAKAQKLRDALEALHSKE